MKKILRKIIFFVLFLFSKGLANKASILMYHSVGRNPAFFTVQPVEFEKQILFLKKKNYNVVFLSELLNYLKSGNIPDKTVAITFDDGYQDNYDNVFPIIKKYKLSISIFLVTGKIGQSMTNSENINLPILNKNQTIEMFQSGLVEFLPHTHTHRKLSTLSLEEASRDIEQSFSHLDSILPGINKILAYPKGDVTNVITDYLKTSGWLGAVSTGYGLVNLNSNHFLLSRNSIDSFTDFIQFKGKLSEAIETYNKIKHV